VGVVEQSGFSVQSIEGVDLIAALNYAYDKAKYHFETVRDEGLPDEHASNHAVYFLGWLIERGMTSDFFNEECHEPVEKWRSGEGRLHDVYEWLDACLVSDMLTDEGNAFAMAYFDFEKGAYLKDYEETLLGDHESNWHIPFTDENYRKMKAVIDRRYEEWKNRPPKAERLENPAKPWWKFW